MHIVAFQLQNLTCSADRGTPDIQKDPKICIHYHLTRLFEVIFLQRVSISRISTLNDYYCPKRGRHYEKWVEILKIMFCLYENALKSKINLTFNVHSKSLGMIDLGDFNFRLCADGINIDLSIFLQETGVCANNLWYYNMPPNSDNDAIIFSAFLKITPFKFIEIIMI
jgi:hypothetical protein